MYHWNWKIPVETVLTCTGSLYPIPLDAGKTPTWIPKFQFLDTCAEFSQDPLLHLLQLPLHLLLQFDDIGLRLRACRVLRLIYLLHACHRLILVNW